MGGLLILGSVLIPTLLWADLANQFVWVAVLATAAFGGIGFADDYLKIVRKSHHGLLPRYKMGWQVVVAAGVGIALLLLANHEPTLYSTRLIFPFFKRLIPDLGWFYVAFTIIFLVGATNEVNLTDGLDGLAISVFAVSAAAFTALAYVSTHVVFSNYLQLVRLNSEAAELTIFCGALVGAALGFLWFNSYPAQVFMGDVGSLALGGSLGTLAVVTKSELLLPLIGGIYVVEAASVIIQVASFKLTGRRVFRMAPLHHHYEIKGWAEPKIIVRFWIVSIMLALLALTTLKLR